MSRHNYSQYSKKNDTNRVTEVGTSAKAARPPLIPADLVDVSNTDEVKMVAKPVNETADTVTLPKTVKGIVNNCSRLNVRAYPSLDAEVVCILDVMSELEIDPDKSTYDWLCVCTATGVDGYCMKKFVDTDL